MHFKAVVTRTLTEDPMLEDEPTGHRTATKSGRNVNEAIAGAVSEAFAVLLHHRYAVAELPSAGHIV